MSKFENFVSNMESLGVRTFEELRVWVEIYCDATHEEVWSASITQLGEWAGIL